MNNKIIIYTDGSCDKNPGGNGGFSSILFIDENPIFLSGYENNTTNQRMEIKAVINALTYLVGNKEYSKISNHEIVICTDSAYVCNCILSKWYKKWIMNGWKNSNGESVANKDLWEELLFYIDSFKNIQFMKVKGHSDNIFNNKCDQMAKDIISFKKEINIKIQQEKEKTRNVL